MKKANFPTAVVLLCLTFFFLLIIELQSQACPTDSLIINTGYNPASGSALPQFVNDPLWTVVSDPFPNTFEPRPATTINKHPAWAFPFLNSQWIAVYNSYANNTNGIYEYERCFCIKSGGRFRIKLSILADDTVAVFLGGNYLGGSTPSGFGGQFVNPLGIDTIVSLTAGIHCLRFIVGNIGYVAHGLNVAGTIISLNPTPMILADSCCPHPGFIIGQKFNDLNCNGKPDYGEPVLSNWGVIIQGLNSLDTVYTGSDGWYSAQVSPGNYLVSEVLQPGWSQTHPSGPQQITVHSGEVVTINFLNCQQPPCDTLGTIELDSACCQFTVPVFNLGQNPLTQIQWQILNNSGTMESITVLSNCGNTMTPQNPYGATSGSINFSGSGCTSNPTLIMEANPSTVNGIVTIAFTFIHEGQICRDTVNLHCARAPLIKCDSLVVAPFTFHGLNLSGRTFTIFNQKQPTSPIKEVKINLIPDPLPTNPNFKWNGGGLFIDNFPRTWSLGNSGNPYYSTISLDCDPQNPPQAPQGNAANTSIKFNLGVDYTLNWTGNVILTIIHCDGDTCELTYNNWCAKPPKQCIKIDPILIDTSTLSQNIVAGHSKFSLRGRDNVKFVAIELAEKDKPNVQVIGAFAGIIDNRNNIIATGKTIEYLATDEPLPKKSSIIELPNVFGGRDEDCQLIVFFMGDSVVKFNVILFDENVNPIGFETFEASKPISSVKQIEGDILNFEMLKVSPNPTSKSATIEYFITMDGNVTLQIIDILGRNTQTLENGWKPFGFHTINVNLNSLSSGSYIIILKLPNGKVISKPLLIAN